MLETMFCDIGIGIITYNTQNAVLTYTEKQNNNNNNPGVFIICTKFS